MDHVVAGSPRVHVASEVSATTPPASPSRTSSNREQRLRLVKLVAYGWSSERTVPALRDQVAAALEAARLTGWEGLVADQRRYLDDFWSRADVAIEGSAELQQAVRFALFHVLQAAARAEGRGIPAKGLTGTGYDGHSFWDSETFILPVLTHTASGRRGRCPSMAARDPPDRARARAEAAPGGRVRSPGAPSTARSARATGPPEPRPSTSMPTSPTPSLRYVDATGDTAFERDIGVDILVETARLWRSLGHHDVHGAFRIDGVTGPDEYSAIADNNVYTNLMARRNLVGAAEACTRHEDKARELGVTPEEMAGWRAAAEHVFVPTIARLGVHQQAEGFTTHEVWDFAATRPDQYPLMLHFPYFDLYRKQVVKQADLVLAMQLCSDAFTPEEKARNFDYYERITVRDSSLSACTQAVLAAEVGHLAPRARLPRRGGADGPAGPRAQRARRAAHRFSGRDVDRLVSGFGGMRDHGGTLSFAPRLPEGLTALSFTIVRRGLRLHVSVSAREATYRLLDPRGLLELVHHGERLTLRGTTPVERAIPSAAEREPPKQPPGREPRHRSLRRE